MSFAPGAVALNAIQPVTDASVNPTALKQPSANSSEDFLQALAAAEKAQSESNTVQVPGVGQASASAAANERARRVLQLDGSQTAAPNGDGDAVLTGLQKLRGAFDKQISTFSISSAAAGTTEGLYRAQIAAANFSIFMDVSSKLAGKGEQTLNSLLKGQ